MAERDRQVKPILLDFTASWCSTCQVLDRIIKGEIRPQYEDKIKFVEIDVNEDTSTAEKYDVLSVPTLILCQADGSELWRKVGLVNKDEIKRDLDEAMAKMRRG